MDLSTPPPTPRRQAPTLKDVAALAGVSLSTASRTLNGQSELVRAELRARVLAASRELSYVPNAQAQGLARATTSTIGLIVHDVMNPYFSAIAQGAIERATADDLFVVICSNHRDPGREMRYLQSLSAQRVRAVILAGSGFEAPQVREELRIELDALQQIGVRVACISDHNVPVDTVVADDRGGAERLGSLLLDLGHREYGVIAGPPQLTATRHRMEGLSTALTRAGIALGADRIADGRFTRDGGYAAAAELMQRVPGVTAIVAITDVMAVGALAALRDLGIDVPGQVSVTGFGDVQLASDVFPALTTVRVPTAELGSRATSLVLGPKHEEPQLVHLPTEVVARASTSPPGAGRA